MEKTRLESKREAENTRKVFDKVQKCDADSVDSIEVDVERIDVRFHHWTSQIITVKFCGEADIASGDIEFDTYILRNRLYVETKVKGIVETSNLKLDIWLPGNIFDEIRVNGNSAQVEINSGVVARLVRVETLSGNIDIRAIFIKAIVKSNGGNVNMHINAQSRVDAQISTSRGDISIFLKNVRKVNLSAKSQYGKVLNKNRGQYGYIASLKATTKSGNITVE